jgi:hypothetical protein
VSWRYILVGHEPVEEPDLLTWGQWFEEADRHVALTEQGDVRVSTVFLGLDHRVGPGPPLLFETMAFVGDEDEGCERYATWDEAEEGHKRWVAKVFKPTHILPLPALKEH